jgi:hypothetical protein
MSTSASTSTLDEKREEAGVSLGGVSAEDGSSDTDKKTTKEKWISFLKTYVSSLLFTITLAIFVVGGTGLFASKVAQANILPTNVEWSPFTGVERDVAAVAVDMHSVPVFSTSAGVGLGSQKGQFSTAHYNLGFKDSFLCSLKAGARPEKGILGTGSLFFYNVFSQLTAKNAMLQQTVFGTLSQLPEWAVMVVYGLFGWLFWMGLYFANFGMNLFYMLVNIPQLFRVAAEKDEKAWQPDDAISFRIWPLVLLCFLWFPLGVVSAFVTPVLFSAYALMLPLFAKYIYSYVTGKSGTPDDVSADTPAQSAGTTDGATNGTTNGTAAGMSRGGGGNDAYTGKRDTMTLHSLVDFMKDVFTYKKQLFIVLASVSLVYNAFSILDTPSAMGTCVAVLAMYLLGAYQSPWGGEGGELPDGFTKGWMNTMRSIPKAKAGKVMEKGGICKAIPVWEGKEATGWLDFLFKEPERHSK